MHYEILDSRRQSLLPLFEIFKGRFYLAGGTALALQLGHRDSIDFDFFTPEEIRTDLLFEEIRGHFGNHELIRIQDEKNTLGILADSVSISFIRYPYPLLNEVVASEHLDLASIEDIACMKCSAITSRSTLKDYVDLHVLLKLIPLSTLVELLQKKMPSLDPALVLKSLVYFADIHTEPIRFVRGHEVSLDQIRADFESKVKAYLNDSR